MNTPFCALFLTHDGESVNIGLVIFRGTDVDVRVVPSLGKVAALNGQINLDSLRTLPALIAKWTEGSPDTETRHALLRNLGVASVSRTRSALGK